LCDCEFVRQKNVEYVSYRPDTVVLVSSSLNLNFLDSQNFLNL
jgi:hypothetical protein